MSLLAQEQMVLEGLIDRLTAFGKWNGMDWNGNGCGKAKVMRI
jgi:hypothetical protein